MGRGGKRPREPAAPGHGHGHGHRSSATLLGLALEANESQARRRPPSSPRVCGARMTCAAGLKDLLISKSMRSCLNAFLCYLS